MDGIPSSKSFNAKLRDSAMSEVNDEQRNLAKNNPIEFIRQCHKRFVLKRVEAFPEMCEIARVQNILKKQELEKIGQQGRYTNSYGWSADRQFKHDYEIPEELYLFMQNLIYKDFWSEDNEKIWRKFMRAVVAGEDPGRLLIWVKSQYGANSQEGIVN